MTVKPQGCRYSSLYRRIETRLWEDNKIGIKNLPEGSSLVGVRTSKEPLKWMTRISGKDISGLRYTYDSHGKFHVWINDGWFNYVQGQAWNRHASRIRHNIGGRQGGLTIFRVIIDCMYSPRITDCWWRESLGNDDLRPKLGARWPGLCSVDCT